MVVSNCRELCKVLVIIKIQNKVLTMLAYFCQQYFSVIGKIGSRQDYAKKY